MTPERIAELRRRFERQGEEYVRLPMLELLDAIEAAQAEVKTMRHEFQQMRVLNEGMIANVTTLQRERDEYRDALTRIFSGYKYGVHAKRIAGAALGKSNKV